MATTQTSEVGEFIARLVDWSSVAPPPVSEFHEMAGRDKSRHGTLRVGLHVVRVAKTRVLRPFGNVGYVPDFQRAFKCFYFLNESTSKGKPRSV